MRQHNGANRLTDFHLDTRWRRSGEKRTITYTQQSYWVSDCRKPSIWKVVCGSQIYWQRKTTDQTLKRRCAVDVCTVVPVDVSSTQWFR